MDDFKKVMLHHSSLMTTEGLRSRLTPVVGECQSRVYFKEELFEKPFDRKFTICHKGVHQ